MLFFFLSTLSILSSLCSVSALAITDVQADTLSPGKEGQLTITITNDEDQDLHDISFFLELASLPLISIGSSEDSTDKIREDDDDKFSFILRANPTAKPGEYNIPYILTYRENPQMKKGTIGIKITAPTEVEVSLNAENPVLGQQGRIILKIINKGQADARFVKITIVPSGYTIISEDTVYIGTIDSDDFDTATFDVLFTSMQSHLSGILEYLDAENVKTTRVLDLPIKTYSKQQAQELGILPRNNVPIYLGIIIFVILIWILWRIIRKKQRLKKSMKGN